MDSDEVLHLRIISALLQRLNGKADLTKNELDANVGKNIIVHSNGIGAYQLELRD